VGNEFIDGTLLNDESWKGRENQNEKTYEKKEAADGMARKEANGVRSKGAIKQANVCHTKHEHAKQRPRRTTPPTHLGRRQLKRRACPYHALLIERSPSAHCTCMAVRATQ
jgi:hypothetical protein